MLRTIELGNLQQTFGLRLRDFTGPRRRHDTAFITITALVGILSSLNVIFAAKCGANIASDHGTSHESDRVQGSASAHFLQLDRRNLAGIR
ncbi:hypothetical protein M433DRAFT_376245 [Acidomyces richmondensis BFW]|nr:MAG: hypothetical protein FE78DRAFT_287040 [Acidomyces sp. 'richmondensis']KYG48848.1 hypothetical protein M433DRAFT_376245 [Acidomyces richmondensis BFW]